MTLPRQGLGLGVAAVMAATLFSSCSKAPQSLPVGPVAIPVDINTDKVADAVRNATLAANNSAMALRRQADILSDAQVNAELATQKAEEAYSIGLEAGSSRASELKETVAAMEAGLVQLQRTNETLQEDSRAIAASLRSSQDSLSGLQKEVGRAEAALEMQTQIATHNKAAFEEVQSLYQKESEEKARAEEGKRIAQKWVLWLGITLAVIVSLIVTYVIARVNGWFTRF